VRMRKAEDGIGELVSECLCYKVIVRDVLTQPDLEDRVLRLDCHLGK